MLRGDRRGRRAGGGGGRPRRARPAAAASGLHLAGGLLPSPEAGAPILYETWLVPGVVKFDQAAHAAISAVVTVALFQALGHVVDPRRAPPVARAMLALLACWGFGAANELFEFLSSLRFADAYVGGLDNAGWDLAFNTFGSSLAAVWCALGAPSPGPATGEEAHAHERRGPLVRPRPSP